MKRTRLLRRLLCITLAACCIAAVPPRQAAALDTPLSQAWSSIPQLSDTSDYQALNLFLSNFSESYLCGYGSRTFNASHSSSFERAQLAFTNYAQNGGAVEYVDYGMYNVRVPVSKLNNTLDHLLGFSMKGGWSDLSRWSGAYYYEDGYLYTQITNGFLLCGPTVATKVTRRSDNTIKVKFHAYYQTSAQTGYQIGGKAQYGMSESELNRLLHVSGPNKRGTAIVRVSGGRGNWDFELVRWTVRDY